MKKLHTEAGLASTVSRQPMCNYFSENRYKFSPYELISSYRLILYELL